MFVIHQRTIINFIIYYFFHLVYFIINSLYKNLLFFLHKFPLLDIGLSKIYSCPFIKLIRATFIYLASHHKHWFHFGTHISKRTNSAINKEVYYIIYKKENRIDFVKSINCTSDLMKLFFLNVIYRYFLPLHAISTFDQYNSQLRNCSNSKIIM